MRRRVIGRIDPDGEPGWFVIEGHPVYGFSTHATAVRVASEDEDLSMYVAEQESVTEVLSWRRT